MLKYVETKNAPANPHLEFLSKTCYTRTRCEMDYIQGGTKLC